jgi:hypothetical protein
MPGGQLVEGRVFDKLGEGMKRRTVKIRFKKTRWRDDSMIIRFRYLHRLVSGEDRKAKIEEVSIVTANMISQGSRPVESNVSVSVEYEMASLENDY